MTKVDTVAIRPVDNDQPVTTSAKKKEKKRKPYVKRACLSCHSAHVACESERPCKRCKKKGIACVDYIPSKKKSSSSTKEDDDEQTDVSDNENVEQEQTSPRKKKRRSPGEPSCVVRIAAPSSSTMDEQQTSSNNTKQQQQQQLEQQSEALNNSSSTLVKSALTQSSSNSSEKKRKTASKRKKDTTSQLPSVKIEDVPLDEDSMHTSSPTITSADPVSFDPITNNNLPIPQQQSASMNSTDNSANDNKSQMSMYQPYFWNQNPMMQQWFAMQMAQYQAHNQHLQQTGQSQAMVYPPYFMMPVMPQQAQTSFPVQTPTSPMQTDVAMSPSTAFPTILEQPYNPYAYPYNVPKPITMLENTDDGFSFFDNSPNTYNDGNALIEELDVNNNGLVEEHSNDGYANHEEKPTQTVTTPPPNNNTTDNLAFFEDDENDYFTTSDTYPNFPDYTSSPQPTFQEPQEKRKQIASQPPQKAANDDDIIDLITSEASLLTEKAKEQQNNIQNNSPNTSVSNVDSSGINLSDMDLTVNDINYVISQAPDNMISKQTIGEIIKRIWQTQENQTKEINELKKLVSELKRMIIS